AAPVAATTGVEVSAGTLERLRHAVRRRGARVRRLRQELDGAGAEAEALRARGDLLLSRLGELKRGMAEATLTDFEGARVRVPLDPALSPTENAERCYGEARRKGRAAERVPALLERARTEGRRLADLLRRAEAGEAGEEEVTAALGPAPAEPERRGGPALPYRRYRTSGGLEVRVGRNRRANDDLTFHHSSPGDVWLHARDVGGAHVVLRWTDADASPPAVDLAEAAVLAALHSRSRTSGTVPVDWTRRKYVRKPRKAPPGLVVLERAKTLFVEPDPAVERRLRVDEE
ncbi:MAG TPA: NFACT RNA binding domain-containing protein, partial [Longimicrobiales bacterium]|nr:NFACT RNA binding domain-containing protein [Longimicrobiales bacterium]